MLELSWKKRHKNAKANLWKPEFSVLNQIDKLSFPGQDWVSRLDGDISVGAGITIIPVLDAIDWVIVNWD